MVAFLTHLLLATAPTAPREAQRAALSIYESSRFGFFLLSCYEAKGPTDQSASNRTRQSFR
jgi:hypothetical protein